jgi:hypothetical protein
MERSEACVDVRIALFGADNKGVGECKCGVGQEKDIGRRSMCGEIVEVPRTMESSCIKTEFVVIDAASTIGGKAADRSMGDKAQIIVTLHLEGFAEVGEDAGRGEDTAELQAVDIEVGQLLETERFNGVVEALSAVLAVLNGLATIVDVTILATCEDGELLVFGEA